MSRSGYSEDIDDLWEWIRYRGAVASAIKGARGQAFFKELLAALDAMPEKRLIRHELQEKGAFCTLGALGNSRGMAMDDIGPDESDEVALAFGIAESLAREVVFMNDEGVSFQETPEKRWSRMRGWVIRQIKSYPENGQHSPTDETQTA